MPLFAKRKGTYSLELQSPGELAIDIPPNTNRRRKFSAPAIWFSEPVVNINVKPRTKPAFGGQFKSAISRLSSRGKSNSTKAATAPELESQLYLWMPTPAGKDGSKDGK